MQRLGKNLGGYRGETIDIVAVLRDVETAAQTHGWKKETFFDASGFQLIALHRLPLSTTGSRSPARVYISTGIHGDEPAGPLAALRLLQENRWADNLEIILLPCLNPAGFTLNQRENPGGMDLNRDYRRLETAEIRAHVAWLEKQPAFDLYLCLHEDWESHGFYLYEQNPDGRISFAEKIITEVQKVCPIDHSTTIEDRPAQNGIIRPNVLPAERPDWPEAFYLISYKSRLGYTLEAPSDFPQAVRVDALVAGVGSVLQNLTH